MKHILLNQFNLSIGRPRKVVRPPKVVKIGDAVGDGWLG